MESTDASPNSDSRYCRRDKRAKHHRKGNEKEQLLHLLSEELSYVAMKTHWESEGCANVSTQTTFKSLKQATQVVESIKQTPPIQK